MNVKPVDLWVMLLSTVRYSMGRQTYMSSLAWELVSQYEAALTKEQLQQIINEIELELKRCESVGSTLGAACDHASWKQGVNKLWTILSKRN